MDDKEMLFVLQELNKIDFFRNFSLFINWYNPDHEKNMNLTYEGILRDFLERRSSALSVYDIPISKCFRFFINFSTASINVVVSTALWSVK